jgi:hypothetical protein
MNDTPRARGGSLLFAFIVAADQQPLGVGTVGVYVLLQYLLDLTIPGIVFIGRQPFNKALAWSTVLAG